MQIGFFSVLAATDHVSVYGHCIVRFRPSALAIAMTGNNQNGKRIICKFDG
jgi:hypothetical protein